MNEKETQFQKRVLELAHVAYEREIVTFSDFLDMNEQHIVHSLPANALGVSIKSYGGYEWSERQMIAFLPDALSYDWVYPIKCLFIRPKAPKYAEKLTHRDYLGALLHLGVLRGKIGDIVLDEAGAYVFCEEKIAAFFLQELTRVRHTFVLVEETDLDQVHIKRKEEEVKGTVASPRLDALISVAFHTSRSSMVPLIEGGKVFVNGKMVVSCACIPKEGDVVSVRGKGKFRVGKTGGTTKKGRTSVHLYRYV